MTKVWIDSQLMENGLIAVNVNVAGAPHDLFGAAFHVVTSRGKWKLSSYQIGSVFEDSEPLLLVTQKNDALITGISLQREQSVQIHDGKLITFFIQPLEQTTISFDFEYPVLSTYKQGRKDVENVEWVGGGVAENVLEVKSPLEMERSGNGREESVAQSTQVNFLRDDAAPEGYFYNVYGFLVLFFIFMGILWYRRWR